MDNFDKSFLHQGPWKSKSSQLKSKCQSHKSIVSPGLVNNNEKQFIAKIK